MEKEYLTNEDFETWLELPQTKALFQAIREEQQDMLMMLTKNADINSRTQARLVGIMAGLQKVLDFTYDNGNPN